MAVTTEGRALTEAHRTAQVEIGADTQKDLLTLTRLLDPRRVEDTFPDYLRSALLVLERDHRRSRDTSQAYLREFRRAEVRDAPEFDLRAGAALAREQAMNSLFFTGPVTIRKGISKLGKSPEEAMTTATVRTLGAGKRLALQGGRDVIMDAVQRDPAVKGVARVTDGDPCYFCAMLASRGAIYRSEETAAFDAHDDCGCEPEPVYSRSDYMTPGRSQEFADLYGQIPGGLSAADSRRAFRGLYERGAVPDKFLG